MKVSGLAESPPSCTTPELPQEKHAKDRSPLFGLINSTHGSFARFARIYRSIQTGVSTPSKPTGTTTLFPSMLPWTKPPGKSKHGRGLRSDQKWEALEWMHLLWCLFNFLESGSPSRKFAANAAISRASLGEWTALHESYARAMYKKVCCFVTQPRGTLDRGSAKLDELISRIRFSQYDPTVDLDEAMCGAMQVNPDRISVPDIAGILDPREHLSHDRVTEFESMPHAIPIPGPVPGDCKACHKVDPKDWPRLLGKLHSAQMISFVPVDEAIYEGDTVIKGGLFGVPHKPDSDRLINDRRPLNQRERRLNWCELPSGVMLNQIILEDHQSIRASGDDLSNYFYLIKHLDEWLPRNCFRRSISGSKLRDLGLSPSLRYYPAFRVVCMGDTNGVDIAQATHEGVLKAAGCLKPDQTLRYGKLFPASDTLEGLYIDDHLVFQIVDKKPWRDRTPYEDETLMARSRDRYAELGLPTSQKKAFNKEYTFKAWGTEVDSKSGRVGTPLVKLRQIEWLAVELVRHRRATKKSLQKLLGLFVHPFMHRRECMSIFHHTYLYVDSLPEGRPHKLPQYICDEILTAVLLLPLATANIRRPVSTRVSATDASLSGGGRASTLTSKMFSKLLYRFSEAKGEHTRLDWEDSPLPPESNMTRAPDAVLRSLSKHHWVATQSCRFARKDHINLLELDMLKEEIKSRVNEGRGECRAVNLCDSRVVVGAFAKGRSSSKNMNHGLRSCLPWLLTGDLQMVNLWVDTHSNPADYPSRFKPIPKPVPCTHDDLLEKSILEVVQEYRSPGLQALLEHEARKKWSDPSWETFASWDIDPEPKTDAPVRNTDKKAEPAADVQAAMSETCQDWTFREIFAGRARLTEVFKRHKGFKVDPPIELRTNAQVKESHDLLDDKVFRQLLKDAKRPRQLWHFGLPCCSFSILQHANHGTRRRHCPAGDGTLSREIIGNELLRRTLCLIKALESVGNLWTLENPASSYVWVMPEMCKKLTCKEVHSVDMHQCSYGLKLRDEHGKLGPCRKHTQFVGNLKDLPLLEKHCSCRSRHVHAVGGVRTKQGWKRRSELAGHYPFALCNRYVTIASRILPLMKHLEN